LKTRKPINRYFVILIVFTELFVLHWLALFIINKLPIKQKLLKTITEQAEKYLHAKISLQDIKLNLTGFTIEGITVFDHNKDTMLHAGKIFLSLPYINTEKQSIKAYKIAASHIYFYHHTDSLGINNLSKWLENFNSEPDSTELKTSNPWKIDVMQIVLENLQLISKSDSVAETPGFFNSSDIQILAQTEIHDFNLEGDIIYARIKKLSAFEKSGLTLRQLEAEINFHPSEISIADLHLALNNSDFYFTQILLNPDSAYNYANVYESGKIKVYPHATKHNTLNTSDLKYFSNKIPVLELQFTGIIKGNMHSIQVQNFNLSLGNHTRLFTNAKVENAFDFENLRFKIPLLQVNSNINLLNKDLGNILGVALLSDTLSIVNFKLKADGSLKNAFIDAQLHTIFGNIFLNTRLDYKHETYLAEGKIWSDEMKSEKLPFLPYDSLKLQTQNSFLALYSKNNLEITAKGKISEIEIDETRLDSVFYDFNMADNQIRFSSSSLDAHLNFNIKGNLNLNNSSIIGKTAFEINRVDLKKLRIDNSDFNNILKIDQIISEFQYTNIDSFGGFIDIKNLKIASVEKAFILKRLILTADSVKNEKRIKLVSDFVNGSIQGKFTVPDLFEAGLFTLNQHLPTVFQTEALSSEELSMNHPMQFDLLDETKKLNFNILIKDLYPLTNVFAPDYYLAPNTRINGFYFLDLNKLEFSVYTDSISVADNKIKNLTFEVKNYSDKIHVNAFSEGINLSNQIYLDQFTMDWFIFRDTIGFECNWGNFSTSDANSGEIKMQIVPTKVDTNVVYNFHIFPTELTINNKIWEIAQSKISIAPDSILVSLFEISQQNQKIGINGKISQNEKDALKISFNQFLLENFNSFLASSGISLSGIMSGQMALHNLLQMPYFFADDTIIDFSLNKQLMGNTYLLTNYNAAEEKINLRLWAEKGLRKKTTTLLIDGYYQPADNFFQLDTIKIDQLPIKTFEPFLSGYLSTPVGYIDANLKAFGNFSAPSISGEIVLSKSRFTIDYLQSRFNLSDTIFLAPGQILLKNFQLEQPKATANINGELNYADGFSEMYFDIGLSTGNFNFLNTKQTDTSYFFGVANLAADARISGTLNDINVSISGKTMPGTRFNIPLSSASDIEETAFISFTNQQQEQIVQKEEVLAKQVSGMQMDFTLNVTPEAEVALIFDEKVGDVIKASGEGNLKILMNANGDLNMYGDYILSKGDYLFTLGNTLNKKFTVEKGGLIRWNGDPYNAEINLNAIYSVKKVALYDLTYDDNDKNTKIPADCKLNMTNNLEQPVILFGIELPTADEDIVQQFNTLPSDELNKQILSLLIFNKFQALPGYKQDASKQAGVGFNTTEMITNQLSHWLSQISNDLDIGINYQSGDSLNSSALEVELSTQLLNERLIINSNFGVSSNNQSTNNQNFVGDMEIEYKIDKAGKFRAKAFTKTNQNDVYFEQVPYSYGLGIFYRHEFEHLFKHYYTKKIVADSTKIK